MRGFLEWHGTGIVAGAAAVLYYLNYRHEKKRKITIIQIKDEKERQYTPFLFIVLHFKIGETNNVSPKMKTKIIMISASH